MALPIDSPYRVPFDGSFRIEAAPTVRPADAPGKRRRKARLVELTAEMAELQYLLYARDRRGVLLVFQGMDAAGKDGTIRAVMSGVDPAGCQVFSFKQPSKEELDHDFLWRVARCMPERGRIGIFNRSHYEEVLVVRVHPEYLQHQKVLHGRDPEDIWPERYESIRSFEQHHARNGTVILKFFLNVSKEEQRQRFLARIDEPQKNWKFSSSDIAERAHWDAYRSAFERALNETSRPWAPWFAVPADSKSYMRMTVAQIIVDSLRAMEMTPPKLGKPELAKLGKMRKALESEA